MDDDRIVSSVDVQFGYDVWQVYTVNVGLNVTIIKLSIF